jgi:DNA-binding NarL/FixJ family response regulator
MEKNRLLICDDHLIFCQGIGDLIRSNYPDISITFCSSISDAQNQLDAIGFSTLIVDIKLSDGNGIDFIMRNKDKLTDATVIVLSAYYNPYIVDKARQAGAHYFIKKEQGASDLFKAIEKNNPSFLSKQDVENDKHTMSILLSKQEKEIVYLISLGHVSREIADLLSISKATVDTHRKNIHRKLNTTNTAELLKLLHEDKI